MSFLRALRAYVGLGPDEEIEDRYLYELNSRRRVLDLDEIEEEEDGFEQAYAEADIDDLDLRRLRVNPRNQPEIDLRDFEADETVEVRPRTRKTRQGRNTPTRRSGPAAVSPVAGGVFDETEYPTNEFGEPANDEVLADVGDAFPEDFDRDFDGDFDDFDDERRDENDGLDRVTAEFLAKKSPFEMPDEPVARDLDVLADESPENNVRTVERDVDEEKKMRRGTNTRSSDRNSGSDGPSDAKVAKSDSVTGRGKRPEEAVVRSLDSMRAKPRTLLPESFGDAKIVADEFKRDVPVLLNLQGLDRDLARRLIDFASGICYALDGSMEKIASQVFLLIPDGAQVSDEDRRRIEERGYAR